MSTNKRASKRSIRVPTRFGDSAYGVQKKNMDKNKDTVNNVQKNCKEKVNNEHQDGDMVGKGAASKEGFVGDLSGVEFPSLSSQVTSSTEINCPK